MPVYRIMINEYNPIKATRDLIKKKCQHKFMNTLHTHLQMKKGGAKWCFVTISKLIAAIKRKRKQIKNEIEKLFI